MTASAETKVKSRVLPCGCRDDEVCHEVSCHDDNLAICGADVSDSTWCRDEDNCGTGPCIVCTELAAVEPDTYCDCPCCAEVPS